MYEFYLRHLDRNNTLKRAALKPLTLFLSMRKYDGALIFTLNGDDGAAAEFDDYDVVELWWRNLELGIKSAAGGFVRLYTAILREWQYITDDNLITTWEGRCISPWGILDWRKMLWPADVTARTSFINTPTETIGKTIVTYNCTASATTGNGRYRAGDLAGMGFIITVAANQGRGSSRDRKTNGGSIQGIISELGSNDDGGDFTLLRSGDALAWELDWNDGQQGDDKYDSVIFSLDKKNMRNPIMTWRSVGAATVGVAAGQGRGADRLVGIGSGDDYVATNDIELYIDARDLDSTAALQRRAGEKLAAQEAGYYLDFEVAQTADTFFSNVNVAGRNTYQVGDVVQAQYFGTRRREVTGVDISWNGRVPSVKVETIDK